MIFVFQICLKTQQQPVDKQMAFLAGIPFGTLCLVTLIIDLCIYMKRHHHIALQTPYKDSFLNPRNVPEEDVVDIPIIGTSSISITNFISFSVVMGIICNVFNASEVVTYVYLAYTTAVSIFNIPLIVYISIDNNDLNVSRERQRNSNEKFNQRAYLETDL